MSLVSQIPRLSQWDKTPKDADVHLGDISETSSETPVDIVKIR